MYGVFDSELNRRTGNIDLKNKEYDNSKQSFSVPENGLYFITSTQRVSGNAQASDACNIILNNSTVIARHDFHCAMLKDNTFETQVTISTFVCLNIKDIITINRSSVLPARPQREFSILKLK